MITNKLEKSLQFFFPYDWCFYYSLTLIGNKIVEGVKEEEGGRGRGRGRGRERDRDRGGRDSSKIYSN